MTSPCIECGAELKIPEDATKDDIISCPECGIDYVIEVDETGTMTLKQLNLEEEDWGE